MPEKLDKKFEDGKRRIKRIKTNLEEKRVKIDSIDPDDDAVIKTLRDGIMSIQQEVTELKGKYEALEKSYLTLLKKTYTNPFTMKRAEDTRDLNAGGIYSYRDSVIAPYNDSVFC